MGLPEEAKNVDMPTALKLATQQLIRDKFSIPKGPTQEMSPEQMLDVVGQLQLFDLEDRVDSEKFWNDVGSKGIDTALGPGISEKLGLPEGIRAGAPASKVLDDAGQLQTVGLELGDRGAWELLNDFQSGKITADQFADAARDLQTGGKPGRGNAGAGRGTVGGGRASPTTPLGSDRPDAAGPGTGNFAGSLPGAANQTDKGSTPAPAGGQSASPPPAGSTGAAPGSSAGGNPGGGSRNSAPGSSSTTPPGSQNPGGDSADAGSRGSGTPGTGTGSTGSGSTTPPGSSTGGVGGGADDPNADDDGMTAEAILGAGSYVVVTHNEDGTYTADVIQVDDSGNYTVVQSETYSDTDGDGTYTGDKGGESSSKPNAGLYEGEETEDGTTYSYESESDSGSSGSSDTDDSAADSDSGTDPDSSDVDEYTPRPDSETTLTAAQRLAMMAALQKLLGDAKTKPGRGGNDSTPNPMHESLGNGTRPYDPKDTVKRPIDGSALNSGANVPLDALQQIQDPNKVQGDEIDPTKIDQ